MRAGEDGFRLILEEAAVLEIHLSRHGLAGHVADAVHGGPEEKQARQDEEDRTERVHADPVVQRGEVIVRAAVSDSAKCAAAVAPQSTRRQRCGRMKYDAVPAAAGSRIVSSRSIMLSPPSWLPRPAGALRQVGQLGQLVRVEVLEFTVEVEQEVAHEEHAHKDVQQDAQLHDEGKVQAQADADAVNAVLHDQVGQGLGDGLAPGDHEEQAHEDRKEGTGQHDERGLGLRQLQAIGDPDGQTEQGRATQQGRTETDERLDLPADARKPHAGVHEPRQENALGNDRAQRQNPDAEVNVPQRPDDGQHAQQHALDRHHADGDVQPAGPQQPAGTKG